MTTPLPEPDEPAPGADVDDTDGSPGRRIGGRSLRERQVERREAVLAAGLDLFGTQGYAATTVDQVCRRAGVSTRSFYEEFENRLALLAALGERIAAQAFTAFTAARPEPAAHRLRARVAALVHALVDDPRVARIAFVESLALDATGGTRRRDLLAVFPEWITVYLTDRFDARDLPPPRRRALAVAASGATAALMTEWTVTGIDQRGTIDELVDDVVDTTATILGVTAERSHRRTR